jgi:hypothetical protein
MRIGPGQTRVACEVGGFQQFCVTRCDPRGLRQGSVGFIGNGSYESDGSVASKGLALANSVNATGIGRPLTPMLGDEGTVHGRFKMNLGADWPGGTPLLGAPLTVDVRTCTA